MLDGVTVQPPAKPEGVITLGVQSRVPGPPKLCVHLCLSPKGTPVVGLRGAVLPTGVCGPFSGARAAASPLPKRWSARPGSPIPCPPILFSVAMRDAPLQLCRDPQAGLQRLLRGVSDPVGWRPVSPRATVRALLEGG